jgi:hypothetical protein
LIGIQSRRLGHYACADRIRRSYAGDGNGLTFEISDAFDLGARHHVKYRFVEREHESLDGKSGGGAAQYGAARRDVLHFAADDRGQLNVRFADWKTNFKPFVFEQTEFVG